MGLKRELGLIDVYSIASGAMISSGLFILPGLAFARAGPSMIVSYILAGLFAVTGVLSQAEIVSAMPKAGGTYFYVKRALGPGVGTVEGLLTWFSLSLKGAFALVGMAAFASIFIDFDPRAIATILTIIFVAVNLVGSKEAGRVQVVLCFFLFSALIYYIIRGFPHVSAELMHPFNPAGWMPTLTTAGFVFVSYGGLLKVASIAEEVKDPGKTVPMGMILSLVTVSLLYFFTVFVTAGVLDADILRFSLTPISDGAEAFMGRSGRIILGIAAMLAFISTANAGIMASSRYPLALSRDRLLPETLSKLGKRTRTPYISIMITGAIMVCFIFFRVDILVKAASAVLIMTYLLSCLSLIILRESRLQNYQPVFHSPLYPWIQIAGIGGFTFMLFGIGLSALITSGSIMICGLFVYWFYGRIRAGREYALLHLIERITAKELTDRTLETELKEIIRERDDIVTDRLDRVIEGAIVLDIEEHLSLEQFISVVADFLSVRLDLEKDTFIEKMREREKESSTVLTHLLAIPHIILEGEGKFDILLARCRGGVAFSEAEKNVRSIFVLTGTRDERNFHLRALAGIAQIVQDPHFEKNWMNARDGEDLRDLILLGKRKR
ncbi:MAG: amino acid permease [Candidatus Krumholzibacteriota bacterium]|nr:amino acid permease [Candidatus Krumholzibacteriota bacterium]